MKKSRKNRVLYRAGAGLMAAATAVAVITMNGVTAEAKTSLGQIETIKNTKSIFNILEIVPEEGTGSIGYYAENQEAVKKWKTTAGMIETAAERTAYVNGIFADLEARNLMSDMSEEEPETPLTKISDYEEVLPWENLDGSFVLPLTVPSGEARYEETEVSGKFVFAGEGKGDFMLESTPVLMGAGAGEYSQNIEYFRLPEGDAEPDKFYYDVEFVKIDQENEEDFVGEKLYTMEVSAGGVAHYLYWGVPNEEYRLEGERDYFKVASHGQPKTITSYTDTVSTTREWYLCPAEECDARFLTAEELENHIAAESNVSYEQITDEVVSYVCSTCGASFRDYDEAVQHYLGENADRIVYDEETGLYTCTEHATEALNYEEIAVHIFVQGHCREIVNYEYHYVCSACGERFDYADQAMAHVPVHTAGHSEIAGTVDPVEITDENEVTTRYYEAVVNAESPFIEDENGRFRLNESYYIYAGSQKGDYVLTEGTEAHTVKYSEVKAKGGYVNNHWFLKHVFDYEEINGDELEVRVISVTPDQLNDRIDEFLDAVDMVVVSAGYDISTGTPMTGSYTFENDLTAESVTAILNAVASEDMPLIIDSAVKNAKDTAEDGTEYPLNIADIATGYTASESSVIQESVYYFTPDYARKNIATDKLREPFIKELDDYTQSASAYNAVYKEVAYENFLRRTADSETENLLDEEISMASCIRYIINYGGQRVENKKTHVRILDIEPMPVNLSDRTAAASYLTKDYALTNWLKDSGLSADDVDITVMSTAEFIGKIENINENYDLIYVGASDYNFNLVDGEPAYNDSSMNGLYYSNIGDTYRTNSNFIGLVKSDYQTSYNGGTSVKNETTVRFSGNDITQTKADEMKVFAGSGLPVVISDKLMNNYKEETNAVLTVEAGEGKVTATTIATWVERRGPNSGYWDYHNGYEISMKAFPKMTPAVDGVRYSYEWYKSSDPNHVLTDGTNSTYTFTTTTIPSNESYFCKVTASYDGVTATAVSNRLKYGSGWTFTEEGTDEALEVPRVTITCTPTYERDWFVSYISSYTFNASLVTGESGAAYQWYYWNGSYYASLGGAGAQARFTVNANHAYDRYLCEVKVGSNYYYSQYASMDYYGNYSFYDANNERLRRGNGNGNGNNREQYVSTSKTNAGAQVVSSASADSTGVTMRASISGNATYEWYMNDRSIVSYSNTYKATAAGSYRCKITINGRTLWTKRFVVSRSSNSIVSGDAGSSATLHAPATSYSINTNRIDNSSILYETLNSFFTRPNVMSETEAMEQSGLLMRYLNLSSPQLLVTEKPADYTDVDAGTSETAVTNLSATLVENDELSYTFRISNPTDATPTLTEYTAKLYVDTNGDGKYAASEELEISVYDEDGFGVEANVLKEGKQYTLKRALPTKLAGVIPWKLVVEVNGKDGLMASEIGYTYRKPAQRTKIRILQIRYKDTGEINLEWHVNERGVVTKDAGTHQKYAEYFKQMYDEGIYEMDITSKTVYDINHFSSAQFGGYRSREEYFQSFDMLIIGFGDMYGNFNRETATAVVNFINTKKAILFTHDTTSFHNYDTNGWGYQFNQVLRDAVSLDRYGVTNTEFKNTVFDAYKNLDNALAEQILTAGYSIAYDAKSGKQTTGETQGYTNIEAVRQRAKVGDRDVNKYTFASQYPGSGDIATTKTVSKVNDGQLTMYPYILKGDTMEIAQTHEQYYQLNMNSNDIVVWYCLSGGNYDKAAHNDVVNGYYIYNCGNVTYSGAGHSTNSVSTKEAQLFVNTMVAAYRAGAEAPVFRFEDSTGEKEVSQQSVAVEYQTGSDTAAALQQSVLEDGIKVFFKISDPNLTSDKTITCTFTYRIGEDEFNAPTVVKLASDDSIPSAYYSDRLYYIEVPAAVLEAFSAAVETELVINGKVTTEIGSASYIGTSTMTIHKLGLLSLR